MNYHTQLPTVFRLTIQLTNIYTINLSLSPTLKILPLNVFLRPASHDEMYVVLCSENHLFTGVSHFCPEALKSTYFLNIQRLKMHL